MTKEPSGNYLLNKILQDSEPSIDENMDISVFFKLVFHKDFFLSNEAKFGMKKLFDEFVRDIHYEESQIKIRQRNQISFSKKTVSITSKYLFISSAVTEEDMFMELIKQVSLVQESQSKKPLQKLNFGTIDPPAASIQLHS